MTGQFATSKAGHDKNQIYVIVAEEGDFVYLCDGKLRTVAKPKKKRLKHIQIIHQTVEQPLLDALRHREKVMNEQIKFAIKQYRLQNHN